MQTPEPTTGLPEHMWAMVIDLDRCTGCSACVVACHAENNVPMVPADRVVRGHAMHWIRIERYWAIEGEEVGARFLPVLCQHCETAPCEPVCPVFATYHSHRQHLNVQAYNRCVGTRYCGNNDPYKVRFFNWFTPSFDAPLEQQLNPDVTVRSHGVMEKCTFCVQRILRAEQQALTEGREVRDGDVVPACVQTCPPSALIFGDLNDEGSQIAQIVHRTRARQFKLLEDLGTQPKIYYLKGGETHGA